MSAVESGNGSKNTASERATLRADGASRGNPGPAAIGYALFDAQGRELAAEGRCIGRATNNEAEYRALIAGLERAIALRIQNLEVRLDSELVVLQLCGRYRVRTPHLIPLHQRARSLLSAFASANVRHVRRHENKRADDLANVALDAAGNRA
jgi:ribonuclease HI